MIEHTGRQYITARTIWYAVYLLVIVGLSLGLCLPHPFYLISFAIPAVVLLVVLTITCPYVGLLIYSVFFLVRPHEFVGILMDLPFPIERSFAALLLAVMIIKLILKARAAVELRDIDYALMIFLGMALLSVPASIWVDNAWTTWMKLFRLFVVYVLITQIIDTKGQLKFFVLFIILTSAFHASASVVNYYRGIVEFRMGIERAIGLDSSYGNPNSLAATIVYTLPFIYYIFTKYRSLLMKLFLIALTGVMLWCIVLTGSRTGMVGVLFLMLLIIWQSRHRVVSLAAVLVLVVAVWTVMPNQYKARFESTTDIESDTGAAASARGRIDGFLNGVKMFADRPILGYGIGNFGTAAGMVLHRGWHQSHSLPGQMLGELGLLGCLAFILWMYYLFKNLGILSTVYTTGARPDKFMADMALALKLQLFCLFFMGLGGHNLYRFNWFVITALVVVMLKIHASESSEKATLTGLSSPTVEAQGGSI